MLQYDTAGRQYNQPMLVECWTSVSDGGPTFDQHWVNVLCFLGGAPHMDFIHNTQDNQTREINWLC